MKVAIIIPRLESLGPVLLIQTLVNSLCKIEDLKIDVYYFNKKDNPSIKMSASVICLDSTSLCYEEYDVIHTNGIRPDLLAFLNRKRIKYHISTIHNFVFEDLLFTYNRLISYIFGRVWLRIWKRADKLVCISKAMKGYYTKWFCELKLEVIYNGIPGSLISIVPDDDILYRIESFHKRGLKVLGVAGTLTKIKGFELIISLLSEKDDCGLIIIGNGKELSGLLSLAHKLKIEDRCFFGGFRTDAKGYLKYFDYFIIPSRSEGFSLVLIEAVQQKVPVICSDIEVFRELYRDNEVTFFTLDNTKSLIDALKIAEVTGKAKAELAYEKYLNNFTAETMAGSYYKLYKSVSLQLDSTPSPAP
jgi:L-malate glycosyltransferase